MSFGASQAGRSQGGSASQGASQGGRLEGEGSPARPPFTPNAGRRKPVVPIDEERFGLKFVPTGSTYPLALETIPPVPGQSERDAFLLQYPFASLAEERSSKGGQLYKCAGCSKTACPMYDWKAHVPGTHGTKCLTRDDQTKGFTAEKRALSRKRARTGLEEGGKPEPQSGGTVGTGAGGGGRLTGAALATYAVFVGGPQLITMFLVHLVMSNMPFRQLDGVNWKSFVACMGAYFSRTQTDETPLDLPPLSTRTVVKEFTPLVRALYDEMGREIREDLYGVDSTGKLVPEGDTTSAVRVTENLHPAPGKPAVAVWTLPVTAGPGQVAAAVEIDAWQSPMGPQLWTVRRFRIGLFLFPHPHSAEAVLAIVAYALALLGLTTDNIMVTTTDGGSNMLKAFRIGVYACLWCWKHGLDAAAHARATRPPHRRGEAYVHADVRRRGRGTHANRLCCRFNVEWGRPVHGHGRGSR